MSESPGRIVKCSEHPHAEVLSLLLSLANVALERRGAFHMALSGGGTPRALYALLAASDTDFSNWHFWFGDERHVPLAHKDSNYRMAKECLLDPAGIPADRVHAFPTKLDPPAAAEAYAAELVAVLGGGEEAGIPRLDFVLLGMGVDGHTASLFPVDPNWRTYVERVVAVEAPGIAHCRLTLTLPVLNAARNVAFLIVGEAKSQRLKEVLDDARELPAAAIAPSAGELTFFIDGAAARKLQAS